jgi:hypothetical protein
LLVLCDLKSKTLFKPYKFFQQFLLLITLLLLITSCEKTNNEYSAYILSINNSSSTISEVEIFLNDEFIRSIGLQTQRQASYINTCEDISNPEALVNTFVIKDLPIGNYKVEIKADNKVLKTIQFTVKGQNCVMQSTVISDL